MESTYSDKKEMKITKEKDLFLTKKGKLFEQYVASFIARELGEINYKTGIQFSISKEIKRLFRYIENKDQVFKDKINEQISEYLKSCPEEIQSLSSSSDGGTSNKSQKKNFDVKGDFDLIIPGVEKAKFEKMLDNNFQRNGNKKFVVGTEKKMPEKFNLFAEIGLNSFHNEYKKKSAQIKKYNYILNFANNIKDNEIYKKYKEDFGHEYYYFQNKNDVIFPNDYVFLIVSNSTYAEFTHRFLDHKNYENEIAEKKMGGLDDILPEESNSNIFCAFVNFDNGINRSLIEKFEAEKQIKELKTEINQVKNDNNYLSQQIEILKQKVIQVLFQ